MRLSNTNRNMEYLGLMLMFTTTVRAIEYYGDLTNSRYAMHFKEMPKRFEVKGGTASKDFKKYFDEIENIAKHENISVVYKVKLEVMKPSVMLNRKALTKKFKSKKYNIPLKKNSMKLSNFEVMLRKMAEQTGHGNNPAYENFNNPAVTTEADKRISSTKQVQLKYKPIISKRKTNYTKVIKPVRNRIITLSR